MKRVLVTAALVASVALASVPLLFAQKKGCEELKTEIAAKLDAKGVKNYTLNIVDEKEVKETDKVVGSCEGGTKRITYAKS